MLGPQWMELLGRIRRCDLVGRGVSMSFYMSCPLLEVPVTLKAPPREELMTPAQHEQTKDIKPLTRGMAVREDEDAGVKQGRLRD